MRDDDHGQRLEHAGFFLLRTPHLPVDVMRGFRGSLEVGRNYLQQLLEQPRVREAIKVASPSLGARLEDPEAEPALVRYIERMATRPTPFGLFAGVLTGTIGEPHVKTTRLEMTGDVHRHVRLDAGYLAALAEALFKHDPIVRSNVVLRPNRALLQVGDQLLYPQRTKHGSNGAYTEPSFATVAIESNEAVRRILARSKDGARLADLSSEIRELAASDDEARAFVDELIDSGMLESEMTVRITQDPLDGIIANTPPESAKRHVLDAVREDLRRLALAPNDGGDDPLTRIAELLAAAFPEVPIDRARLFQVDMTRQATAAVLSRDDVSQIAEGVELLHSVNTMMASSALDDELTSFRTAFVARYGEHREVSLVEALDPDIGVGFTVTGEAASAFAEPTPLLRNVTLRKTEKPHARLSPWESFLIEKLETCWRANATTLRLTRAEIETVVAPARQPSDARKDHPRRRLPMPSSLAAHVTLLAPTVPAHDGHPRHRVLFHGWSGPSASRMLGRFCWWDPDLTRQVRAHLAREREEIDVGEEVILAEVVHLPANARLGNILCRPVLREYEIAFGAAAGVDDEHTISLTDLVISVTRDDEVVLRSRKLPGRRILPRLSSAHAVGALDLPIYRFLVALQSQGVTPFGGFEWGVLGRGAKHLPRVEVGDLIISPRQWRFSRTDIARLVSADRDEIDALRRELNLPSFIGFVDGDNLLPVDLESQTSLRAVSGVVAKLDTARFVELFLNDEDAVVRSPLGGHANELVVPFLARSTTSKSKDTSTPRTPLAIDGEAIQRVFAPGSEWLFMKLYAGNAKLDGLLVDLVRPLVERARQSGRTDRWFFIRYEDPAPHLRVRLHGDPKYLNGELLPAVNHRITSLLAAGLVHRFEVATYEREVERYGGPKCIELAEQLFEADSDAALELNAALLDRSEVERWLVALHSIRSLFDDFGCTLEERLRLSGEIHAGFLKELGSLDAGKETARSIDARYRQERPKIESILGGADATAGLTSWASSIFTERSRRIGAIAPKLRAHASDAKSGDGRFDDLLDSFLHMTNNRLLKFPARPQELVLSGFAFRYYRSLSAMTKQQRGKPASTQNARGVGLLR